jgi:hypothetical protein
MPCNGHLINLSHLFRVGTMWTLCNCMCAGHAAENACCCDLLAFLLERRLQRSCQVVRNTIETAFHNSLKQCCCCIGSFALPSGESVHCAECTHCTGKPPLGSCSRTAAMWHDFDASKRSSCVPEPAGCGWQHLQAVIQPSTSTSIFDRPYASLSQLNYFPGSHQALNSVQLTSACGRAQSTSACGRAQPNTS